MAALLEPARPLACMDNIDAAEVTAVDISLNTSVSLMGTRNIRLSCRLMSITTKKTPVAEIDGPRATCSTRSVMPIA